MLLVVQYLGGACLLPVPGLRYNVLPIENAPVSGDHAPPIAGAAAGNDLAKQAAIHRPGGLRTEGNYPGGNCCAVHVRAAGTHAGVSTPDNSRSVLCRARKKGGQGLHCCAKCAAAAAIVHRIEHSGKGFEAHCPAVCAGLRPPALG